MIKTTLIFTLATLVLPVVAGTDMRSGRPAGQPPLPEGVVSMEQSGINLPKPPDDEPVTPLALTLLGFTVPYSRGWDVYGLRLNTCIPGWTPGHNDIYGIDLGLSGEMTGDAAGIGCNLFDNGCNNFAGLQVAGLHNRIKGESPFAIQCSLLHNRANLLDGFQASLIWNVSKKMNGLQIGLVNYAESGVVVQIGLWNQCSSYGSPLLGIVY